MPYDFYYTGFVNAYYAVPGENLGISSVRERYFLGPCQDEQAYQQTIDFIENYRAEILELIHGFPYLDEKEKNILIGYMENYFSLSYTGGFYEMELKSNCR